MSLLTPVVKRYLFAVAACAMIAALAMPLRGILDLANTVMLFLLTVFLCAVWLGRGPAVVSAFLGVALFDVFFVPPHLSFTVVDAQYLVTFAVMLAVGLITTYLTAALTEQREAAQAREADTRSLYELARELGGALSQAQVGERVAAFFARHGMASALLIDCAPAAVAFTCYGDRRLAAESEAVARSAFAQGKPVFDRGLQLHPFSGATRARGVLVVSAADSAPAGLAAAVASLAGIAVERIHYAEVAGRSELAMETERLRSTMLSSISHDLRTPLTGLVGLSDSLAASDADLGPEVREQALMIRDQAQAMHRMVSNLLEMARMQSGRIHLNPKWQSFDDIVGAALRSVEYALAGRTVDVGLPGDLPLVRFDAVLVERVLCNLLENAAKYSPPGSKIALTAEVDGPALSVSVANDGPGFDPQRLGQVFELFVRGNPEASGSGTGVGLALCRAIVQAHGGTIAVANTPGGATVRFTLPLGEPPATEGDPA